MNANASVKFSNLKSMTSFSSWRLKPGIAGSLRAISSSDKRARFTAVTFPERSARALEGDAPQLVVVLRVTNEKQDGRGVATRPDDPLAGVRAVRRQVQRFRQ